MSATFLGLAAVAVIALLVTPVRRGLAGRRLARLANADDWQGVRTAATAALRLRGMEPYAASLLGTAEIVLGDLRAAREALEGALDDRAPEEWLAAAQRQLATVDRIEGDLARARERLLRHQVQDDELSECMHLVHLGTLDLDDSRPQDARVALAAAVARLRDRVASTTDPFQRAAYGADLAQASTMLARAARELGDLDDAGRALAEALASMDGRAYVAGGLAIEQAELDLARGDPRSADVAATRGVSLLTDVGAALDVARGMAVRAVARARTGDRVGAEADLSSAERVLAHARARTYLAEVARARASIEG